LIGNKLIKKNIPEY